RVKDVDADLLTGRCAKTQRAVLADGKVSVRGHPYSCASTCGAWQSERTCEISGHAANLQGLTSAPGAVVRYPQLIRTGQQCLGVHEECLSRRAVVNSEL